jgi:hypothetical protein
MESGAIGVRRSGSLGPRAAARPRLLRFAVERVRRAIRFPHAPDDRSGGRGSGGRVVLGGLCGRRGRADGDQASAVMSARSEPVARALERWLRREGAPSCVGLPAAWRRAVSPPGARRRLRVSDGGADRCGATGARLPPDMVQGARAGVSQRGARLDSSGHRRHVPGPKENRRRRLAAQALLLCPWQTRLQHACGRGEAGDADTARPDVCHAALRRDGSEQSVRPAGARLVGVLERAPVVEGRWPNRDTRHERAVLTRSTRVARMRAACEPGDDPCLSADAARNACDRSSLVGKVVLAAAVTVAALAVGSAAAATPRTSPAGVQWGGVHFANRDPLAVWLGRRGVTYRQWLRRHPRGGYLLTHAPPPVVPRAVRRAPTPAAPLAATTSPVRGPFWAYAVAALLLACACTPSRLLVRAVPGKGQDRLVHARTALAASALSLALGVVIASLL